MAGGGAVIHLSKIACKRVIYHARTIIPPYTRTRPRRANTRPYPDTHNLDNALPISRRTRYVARERVQTSRRVTYPDTSHNAPRVVYIAPYAVFWFRIPDGNQNQTRRQPDQNQTPSPCFSDFFTFQQVHKYPPFIHFD